MNVRRLVSIGLTLYVAVSVLPASAQNTPSDLSFPWKPGELPGQFWVGRSRDGCVPAQGRGGVWISRPVVPVRGPRGMESICSYTWLGANSMPDTLALRRKSGALFELDPPVVHPNFGPDPERDALWFRPLYELTRARLAMPKQRAPHDHVRAVRVAVLDTAADTPTGYVDPARHGRAVGRVVEELACGELTRCATQVALIPALPFTSRQHALALEPLEAGAVGTRATLAAAIEKASSDWRITPVELRPRNLILNLSLGWSGCWEEAASNQTNENVWSAKRGLGSQAVLAAIGRAACRGALVVAASGNASTAAGCPAGAPGEPRHMFPGLWGGAQVDPAVCKNLGVEAAFSEPRPLLVGISAVDTRDDKCATAAGQSDLVAYGQYLTTPDLTQPNGWTLPLSGTSMSAAAMSGIAAAVWSYAPELSVPKLLGIIGDSSTKLYAPDPGVADFVCNQAYRGASCDDVRRISLCGALASVTTTGACSTPEAGKQSPAGFGTMTPLAPAPIAAIDCDACGAACPVACDVSIADLDAQDGPWVIPQPKPPGCGTCVAVPSLPVFQAEFLYPVGQLVLIVNRSYPLPAVRIALQDASVPALVPTTWLLPLSALGGTSARLVYRASSSLAKESGDVMVSTVPPFTLPPGILGAVGVP